jgi:hypothetical protein
MFWEKRKENPLVPIIFKNIKELVNLNEKIKQKPTIVKAVF